MFICLSVGILLACKLYWLIYVYKVVICVYLFVSVYWFLICFSLSDHNSWFLSPICLKFWSGNLVASRKCSWLGIKKLSWLTFREKISGKAGFQSKFNIKKYVLCYEKFLKVVNHLVCWFAPGFKVLTATIVVTPPTIPPSSPRYTYTQKSLLEHSNIFLVISKVFRNFENFLRS